MTDRKPKLAVVPVPEAPVEAPAEPTEPKLWTHFLDSARSRRPVASA